MAASLVACTFGDATDPARSTNAEQSVSRIDPRRDSQVRLSDITVTLLAGSASGPGQITLRPVTAFPPLTVPGLTILRGVSVSLAGAKLTNAAQVAWATTPPEEPGVVPVVLWEQPHGGVQLLPTNVSRTDDATIVTATTEHFSEGWFGWISPEVIAKATVEELRGVFTGRTNVDQPACEGHDTLHTRINVVSSSGDAVKWCAGTAKGRPFVTIANNRRTFTQVAVPRDWAITDPDNGVSIDQLVRTFGTALESFAAAFPKDRRIVLIRAGQTMTFTAPSVISQKVEITASSSMMGYFMEILLQALDMYAGMARKFAVENAWTGNVLELLNGKSRGVPAELYTAWATCFRSFTDNVSGEPSNSPETDRIPKLTLFAIDCFSAIAKAGIESVPGVAATVTAVASSLAALVGTVFGLVNSLSASVRGLYDEIASLGGGNGTTYVIRLAPNRPSTSASCDTKELIAAAGRVIKGFNPGPGKTTFCSPSWAIADFGVLGDSTIIFTKKDQTWSYVTGLPSALCADDPTLRGAPPQVTSRLSCPSSN